MSQHIAPRPALFERAETYLYAAIIVAGIAVGAIPATPLTTALIALVVFIPLGILATLPSMRERGAHVPPSRRRAAR